MSGRGLTARVAVFGALAAQLAACTLVVGDIELPPAVADAGGLDAALDAQVDAAVDAAILDAEVPGPLAPYAGDWHLYGVTAGNAWGGGAFSATLRIDALGAVTIFDLEGSPLGGGLATGDATLPLLLTIGADGEAAPGVLDLQSGLGAFGGPESVVWAVRPGWLTAPTRGDVGLTFRQPAQGAIFGRFEVADDRLAETARVDNAAQVRADVTLVPAEGPEGRIVLSDDAGNSGAQRLVTLLPGGALGRAREGVPGSVNDGLWLASEVEAAVAPVWPGEQRFFCAGLSPVDEAQPARAQVLAVGADQQVRWDNWGDTGSLVFDRERALLRTATGSGFFGMPEVLANPMAEGRALALLNTDGQSAFGWGAALCVSLAPSADQAKRAR